MIIDPTLSHSDLELIECILHLRNSSTIAFVGGTGCNCEGSESRMDITPIEEMSIDLPDMPVKSPKNFCKRCGRDHKTSWCK